MAICAIPALLMWPRGGWGGGSGGGGGSSGGQWGDVREDIEWERRKRQLIATLSVFADNYVVRSTTTTTTTTNKTSNNNADETSENKTATPWKYDSEVCYEMTAGVSVVGNTDKRTSKLGAKLFKVESLSEKKQDKKKAEEAGIAR